jgi:hypothetical protein
MYLYFRSKYAGMSRFSIGSTAVGLGFNFFMTTEVMMLVRNVDRSHGAEREAPLGGDKSSECQAAKGASLRQCLIVRLDRRVLVWINVT